MNTFSHLLTALATGLLLGLQSAFSQQGTIETATHPGSPSERSIGAETAAGLEAKKSIPVPISMAPPSYAKAAWVEGITGDISAALDNYSRIVDQFDLSRRSAAEIVYKLGETYRHQGRIEEARTEYGRILREFVDFSDLANAAGTQLNLLQPPLKRTGSTVQTPGVTSDEIATNPSVRDLVLEDEKLLVGEIANMEILVKSGAAPSSALLPLKRDLLRVKEQLAAAEQSAARHAGAGGVGDSTPTLQKNRTSGFDNQSTSKLADRGARLDDAIMSLAMEVQHGEAVLSLLETTERPETIPSDLLRDKRFEELKAAYEATLTEKAHGEGGQVAAAAKQQVRAQIETWLHEYYIPELETSLKFSRAQLAALHQEAEEARKKSRSNEITTPTGAQDRPSTSGLPSESATVTSPMRIR